MAPALKAMIAVDESYEDAAGHAALQWVGKHLCASGTEFHVVTVLPPSNLPAPSLAAFSVVEKDEWAEVMRATMQWQARAAQSLETMAQMLIDAADAGVPQDAVQVELIGPAKGSTEIGKQLIEFAKERGLDLIIMGSRGMGSLKKSVMSLVGLGSVSDYCTHNSPMPVVIVRAAAP